MTSPGAQRMVRTFVAVPLPAELQGQILQAATALAPVLPRVKWSRKVENLHVTLKFLAEVDEDRLARFGQALLDRVRTLPRFRLAVRGFGAFPSPQDARILWAGIDDQSGGLADVAAAVDDVAARLGFKSEDRRFHGHVTVGRVRDGIDARDVLLPLADRAFGELPVGEVHVYESQLGRGGAGSTYILRCRAPLGARHDHNEGDHHGDQRDEERHQRN
jgi:RNA 2',3'-cyclic 3'-phosphodiesterase